MSRTFHRGKDKARKDKQRRQKQNGGKWSADDFSSFYGPEGNSYWKKKRGDK